MRTWFSPRVTTWSNYVPTAFRIKYCVQQLGISTHSHRGSSRYASDFSIRRPTYKDTVSTLDARISRCSASGSNSTSKCSSKVYLLLYLIFVRLWWTWLRQRPRLDWSRNLVPGHVSFELRVNFDALKWKFSVSRAKNNKPLEERRMEIEGLIVIYKLAAGQRHLSQTPCSKRINAEPSTAE